MKITKLELKNFKRFTDLTIDLTPLPDAAKLVLLIGTNGSGKSSVFDAFEVLNRVSKKEEYTGKSHELKLHPSLELYSTLPLSLDVLGNYYTKDELIDFNITADVISNQQELLINLSSTNNSANIPANSFYGRSSIRQVSKLTRKSTGQNNVSFEEDTDRPRTYIDRDNRFENDLEKIALSIFSDVFKLNSSASEIREIYIDPINKAFANIFGTDNPTQITLLSITPPLDNNTAEILFKKGTSEIPYDFLSSGEKEIFNILLNLLTRKAYFTDTIYFLDEIDLHLNTQLQKNLLKEITENWIPGNCQLWTASHSLGFIEYANEAEHAAIIDFDNLNFDVPQVIKPSGKTNFDVFEIAVSKEFLSKVFEGKRIVFSENTDTALYNNLNVPDTIFFIAKDKLDVFFKTKNNPAYYGLIDRDYLTDDERVELMMIYKNLYILDYYSIENYLYHPDNLDSYFKNIGSGFNKPSYIAAIETEKNLALKKILLKVSTARTGYPFFKAIEHAAKLKAFNQNNQSEQILAMLDSPDFETFYKVFPAKDFGTTIPQRQNLSKVELAKTAWFKRKIEAVLTK